VLVALQGAGGSGRIVAGQDLLEHLGGGERVDRLGPDQRVRVAVSDDLQVEVVGDAAPGHHRVQLLPGLLAGDQTMYGVGGESLRAVHGGGVAQLNRLRNVAGRQPDGAAVPMVPDRQVTAALTLRTVHRSPFFTQSVAVIRSVRLLARVITCSPTLAGLPSASIATRTASGWLWFGSAVSRWLRARWLSWLTSSWVGASMIASRPLLRSVCQAAKASSVRAVRSPTCTRALSR
jgi:hypothetical protein